jgi:hypothetical protein
LPYHFVHDRLELRSGFKKQLVLVVYRLPHLRKTSLNVKRIGAHYSIIARTSENIGIQTYPVIDL